MAEKTIIWSKNAKSTFLNILQFFTERNGSSTYSLKLLNKTDDILKKLCRNEFIGRPTTNSKTRFIRMDVYLIFYEIKENSIEIVSFWDNRQDDKKLEYKI